MTSSTFVTEDGSTFVTNGASIELETLASERFWELFMDPLTDMEVTSFGTGGAGTSYGFNLQGRGICKRFTDMYDVPARDKLKDEKTGQPMVTVEPCTWNFTSEGDPSDHYIFSAGLLKGWVPK